LPQPGLRTDYSPGYYAAFVIDPDGHRIEAYMPKKQTGRRKPALRG
jgi:hypothetical protein